MKKIAYNAPEMEIVNVKIESSILNISQGGGDPSINPDWGGGNDKPIEWPEDE